MSIPKFIWQTWKTDEVPDKWKDSPISIKKFLPDYKYKLYTDEDNRKFVEKHFPDFLQKYDSYQHGIQRADAIRPMRLYIHGGIYMDLDMKIVDKIDYLFKKGDLIITQSVNYPSLTNMFMASRKKHPIWLEVIEAMKKNKPWWCLIKHLEIMMTTGPGLINKVFINSRHTYVIIPPVLINAYDVKATDEDIKNNVKKSLIVPLGGCSWHSWDSQVLGSFCQDPYKQICIILTIIAIVLLIIYLIYSLLVIYGWY